MKKLAAAVAALLLIAGCTTGQPMVQPTYEQPAVMSEEEVADEALPAPDSVMEAVARQLQEYEAAPAEIEDGEDSAELEKPAPKKTKKNTRNRAPAERAPGLAGELQENMEIFREAADQLTENDEAIARLREKIQSRKQKARRQQQQVAPSLATPRPTPTRVWMGNEYSRRSRGQE